MLVYQRAYLATPNQQNAITKNMSGSRNCLFSQLTWPRVAFLRRANPYARPANHTFTCVSIYPSIYPSIHQSIHPSIHPSSYLASYLSKYLSSYLAIYLSIHPSIHRIYPSFHVSIYPSTHLITDLYPSIHLSFCLSFQSINF